jgi:hypothetical protein
MKHVAGDGLVYFASWEVMEGSLYAFQRLNIAEKKNKIRRMSNEVRLFCVLTYLEKVDTNTLSILLCNLPHAGIVALKHFSSSFDLL